VPRLKSVDKIFKSVEEKVAKATQTATMPALMARAEAKKRKAVDALKTISKKKKGATAKVVDDEETTESGYGGSATAQMGIEVTETLADVDLGGVGIAASLGARDVGAPSMAVFPTLLSEGSSSSEEFGVAEASASASGSVGLAPGRATRSAKSLRQEESDEESDGQPLVNQPPSPTPRGAASSSNVTVSTGGVLGALNLRKFSFLSF
jgi:hypothetical protein